MARHFDYAPQIIAAMRATLAALLGEIADGSCDDVDPEDFRRNTYAAIGAVTCDDMETAYRAWCAATDPLVAGSSNAALTACAFAFTPLNLALTAERNRDAEERRAAWAAMDTTFDLAAFDPSTR